MSRNNQKVLEIFPAAWSLWSFRVFLAVGSQDPADLGCLFEWHLQGFQSYPLLIQLELVALDELFRADSELERIQKPPPFV